MHISYNSHLCCKLPASLLCQDCPIFLFFLQQDLEKRDLHEICFSVLIPAQERQQQFHSGMLESFKTDLSYLQENLPEGKKAKAKELVEHRIRAEYLQHEVIKVPWIKVCIKYKNK